MSHGAVDLLENIGSAIAHTLIVNVDAKILIAEPRRKDGTHEELEAIGFEPTDVSSRVAIPVVGDAPRSSPAVEDDCNASRCRGIRKSGKVDNIDLATDGWMG